MNILDLTKEVLKRKARGEVTISSSVLEMCGLTRIVMCEKDGEWFGAFTNHERMMNWVRTLGNQIRVEIDGREDIVTLVFLS